MTMDQTYYINELTYDTMDKYKSTEYKKYVYDKNRSFSYQKGNGAPLQQYYDFLASQYPVIEEYIAMIKDSLTMERDKYDEKYAGYYESIKTKTNKHYNMRANLFHHTNALFGPYQNKFGPYSYSDRCKKFIDSFRADYPEYADNIYNLSKNYLLVLRCPSKGFYVYAKEEISSTNRTTEYIDASKTIPTLLSESKSLNELLSKIDNINEEIRNNIKEFSHLDLQEIGIISKQKGEIKSKKLTTEINSPENREKILNSKGVAAIKAFGSEELNKEFGIAAAKERFATKKKQENVRTLK